jgi:predicted Zn-dependent protease
MRDLDDARTLAKAALANVRGADQCSASVTFNDEAYSRFGSNYVTQNLAQTTAMVELTYVKNKRQGTASTNDVSPASLRALAAAAAEIAARTPPNAEFVSLATAAKLPAAPAGSVFASTAEATPDARIDKLEPVFARMRRSNLGSAGFTTTQRSAFAVVNSLGVDAAIEQTYAGLEIKAIAPRTSGFAEAFSRDYAAIDAAERAERAASKATLSLEPSEIPPGTYTVILEPPAFIDCLNNVYYGMNASDVLDDKTSWMVGRIGKAVLSPNLSIVDDWSHPQYANAPFASDGAPTKKVTLVDRGVVRDFVTGTYFANKFKIPNTGHDGYPSNAIVLPGTKSRDELIASTERGVLISRTWYTRLVDPREATITGLTRDGVFLIENGKVTKTLKNFRFFTSMLVALADIELGNTLYRAESADTGGNTYLVPDAKIAKFTLSTPESFA